MCAPYLTSSANGTKKASVPRTGGAQRSQLLWRLSIRSRALKPEVNRREQKYCGCCRGQDLPRPRVTPKPLTARGTSTNDPQVDLPRIGTISAMLLILWVGTSIRVRQKARLRKLMPITYTLPTIRVRVVFKKEAINQSPGS